jgi:hypothetical protein
MAKQFLSDIQAETLVRAIATELNKAKSDAADAKSDAAEAKDAKTTAEAAKQDATSAKSTAEAAKTTAEAAKQDATSAKSDAASAKSTAEAIRATAEAAVPKTAVKDNLDDDSNGTVASVKAVKNAVAAVAAVAIYSVVNTLPAPAEAKTNVIYLVPKSTAQTNNVYDEYIYDGSSKFEKIGDTEIDLSNYMLKNEVTELDQEQMDDLLALINGDENA